MSIDFISLIEAHAEKCHMSVRALFDAAGVDFSLWWRWRNSSTKPSTRTLDRLLDVKPGK